MPTTEERYQYMRKNAEAFVESIGIMVDAAERNGNEDLASKLKVWCLMPWQATIRDDDSGDIWSVCEVCGDHIKDESDRLHSDDCEFHMSCVGEHS